MRLIQLWNRYRERIYRNCTDPAVGETDLEYWRNRLFAATLVYTIPFSVVAVIPGFFVAYRNALFLLLVADGMAIAGILAVAFLPGITIFIRKLVFCGLLYLVTAALLYYLGGHGPGLLYLLGLAIFVVLSLEQRYALGAFGLNLLICVLFGFAIHHDWQANALAGDYTLESWIAVASNLIFLSGVAVYLLPRLFNGLQSTMEEQQRLREQVDAKNRELEDFTYTVSHDLKEPLRMVRSFMELLSGRYSEKLDEKAREYIYYASDGARRMTAMIDQLLEYSRVGRLHTDFEPVDLSEVAEEMVKEFAPELEERQGEIRYGPLPVVKGVPVSIRMLFRNLIGNALKYQKAGTRPLVEIAAEEREGEWLLTVKDNGIGIAPVYHEQVFQLFKRLHAGDEYAGSGMGLAICKKIVKQHGGRIWVESEEGEGSRFCFSIPKENT